MKKIISEVFSLIIVGLIFLYPSSLVSALTLTEAYQSALQNDPFLQSDMYAAKAGMEEEQLGLSPLLPEVSLFARKMDNQGQRDTLSNSNQLLRSDQLGYQSLGDGILLRQSLFSLEKYTAYQASKLRAGVAQSQMVSGKQNAVLRVVGTFLDAVLTQQELEIAAAKKKTAMAQVAQATMLSTKGEATETDVKVAQSRYELAVIKEEESDNNRLSKLSTLSQLIGRAIDTLPKVMVGEMPAESANEKSSSLELWLDRAVARNPEIIQKRQAAAAAEMEAKKNRMAYMPQVDLVANVTRNNQDSLNTLNQDIVNHAIGIELNWSLYKGGYNAALIRQTRAKADQAKQEVAVSELRTRLEVEKQYRIATTGRAKLNALAQEIRADQDKIKSAGLLYGAGVKTSVDVLSAQEELAQDNKDYGDALKEFLMAHLKLAGMTNSLNDDDVLDVEKYLQTGKPAAVSAL